MNVPKFLRSEEQESTIEAQIHRLPRPAGRPEEYAPKPKPSDAESARDRHHDAAGRLEVDARTMSDNAKKIIELVEKGIEQATGHRLEAIEEAERDCTATAATLRQAALDHASAIEAHRLLTLECATVMRADGDALLRVINDADAKLKAKTEAILNARPEPKTAPIPEHPTDYENKADTTSAPPTC